MNRAATKTKGRKRAANEAKPRVSSFMDVYEAAKMGGYNGMFFLPSLNVSRNMPTLSREAHAKKALLGYTHIPEMRSLIDGLAIDEVDTALWPKARSSSRPFNKAVTDRFHEENKDPRTFDLRQIESIYSAQFLIRRSIRIFGDHFGQLVRPFRDFLGRLTPSMSFLPGYQCTSDGAKADDVDLRDGIRFDRETGAPAKYRFAKPKSVGADDSGDYVELEANDVLHFHDPFLTGEIRGISALAPFAENMFSMNDIDDAETNGQILRSGIAFAIETIGGDEGQIPRLPGVVDTEVVENPDGSKTVIQKIRTREGRDVQVYTPPSGMKIKTVESNRGGALEYRNHLARGMSHCTIYPPEWTLFIAGLGQGTVFRGVQNRVQKIANFFRANQLEQFVSRWYNFWLWKRIQAGVFDKVDGGVPDDWFLHKIIYPANMSVDLGREGRLYADLVATGKMSWSDYHALFGRDDEDVDEELVDKAIARKILLEEKVTAAQKQHPKLTLDFAEVWRLGTANQPAVPVAITPDGLNGSNGNNGSQDRHRRLPAHS